MSDEHLGGSYLAVPDTNTFMPDVWAHLAEKYHVEHLLDVGCGAGWNTAWWHEKGFFALGIEGWQAALDASKMPQERLIKHDYTHGPLYVSRRGHSFIARPQPFNEPPTFELALCSEFVEHVEAKYVPNFIATFQCCDHVCMTHGEPDQPGHHHVNCQTDEYWELIMEQAGFTFDEEETKWLRATDTYKAGWGRRTLMMFHNQHPKV